jgi:hypothetical protein
MKIIPMLLLFIPFSFTQQTSNSYIEDIINKLLTDSKAISNCIFPVEFEIAARFGIEYDGIENKFLIANNIPKEISNNLLNGKIKYEFNIKNLEYDFSLLTFTIPALNFSREYFIKDSFLVTSAYYHSRNWKIITSDHFKFFVSDETLFNDYSIDQLEKFVSKMFDVLKYTKRQKELIKQKKIYYFLCKDESEIRKVTGFATRGIYILAQDYVITTYNTHYHELLHFLINFKIRKLPLYTHPFLQEGFAVAFGGRGGLDAHTISEMGVFLVKSGFANYAELLSRKDFHNTDASISYPISGLYIDFIIKHIGIEKFIDLYKKYSASLDLNLIDRIDVNELPDQKKWGEFVDPLIDKNPVRVFDVKDYSEFDLIVKHKDFEVYQNEDVCLFRVKDTLLISFEEKISNYQSKIFNEHLTNRNYNSEKYLIIANQNEVSIFNLYSNNLIGKYVASFSIPPKTVPTNNGFYEFVVNKNLFDENLKEKDFGN